MVYPLLKIHKGNQVICGRDMPQIVRPNPDPFTFPRIRCKLFLMIRTTFLQRFQIGDPFPLSGSSSTHILLAPFIYFFLSISLHHAFSPETILQRIFAHRARFIIVGSLIPAPPQFFGPQTVSQLIRWNFFEPFYLPPYQRNFLISFVISCITFFGAKEIEQV